MNVSKLISSTGLKRNLESILTYHDSLRKEIGVYFALSQNTFKCIKEERDGVGVTMHDEVLL